MKMSEKFSLSDRVHTLFRGHPVSFLFLAAGASFVVIGSYKLWLKPYFDYQRRLEARDYAEYLYHVEEKGKK